MPARLFNGWNGNLRSYIGIVSLAIWAVMEVFWVYLPETANQALLRQKLIELVLEVVMDSSHNPWTSVSALCS